MKSIIIIGLLLLPIVVMPFGLASGEKCELPGDNHKDNKPSEKKADELIKEGASICELAKKCDSMEIDVKIKDKQELHEKIFYKNAPSDVKKELDESAEHGKGHDSPNIVCYELEYSVKE